MTDETEQNFVHYSYTNGVTRFEMNREDPLKRMVFNDCKPINIFVGDYDKSQILSAIAKGVPTFHYYLNFIQTEYLNGCYKKRFITELSKEVPYYSGVPYSRVIAINNIESGVYHKKYKKIVDLIYYSIDKNVQFFITTESIDFIRTFHEYDLDKLTIYRIEKRILADNTYRLVVVYLNEEAIKTFFDSNWEIR